MLMKNPKEFNRVAAEWAVEHAGAPAHDRGGSSAAGEKSGKKVTTKSREEEEAERLAELVQLVLHHSSKH